MMRVVMDQFLLQNFTVHSLSVKHTHTHTLSITALSLAQVRTLLMFLHPLDVAQQLKAMPHLTEVREEAGQTRGARKGVRLKGLSQRWRQGEVVGRKESEMKGRISREEKKSSEQQNEQPWSWKGQRADWFRLQPLMGIYFLAILLNFPCLLSLQPLCLKAAVINIFHMDNGSHDQICLWEGLDFPAHSFTVLVHFHWCHQLCFHPHLTACFKKKKSVQ